MRCIGSLGSCVVYILFTCFVWVVVGVLPLRDVDQLAHHVRDALRGDGNASQLAVTAMRHAAV